MSALRVELGKRDEIIAGQDALVKQLSRQLCDVSEKLERASFTTAWKPPTVSRQTVAIQTIEEEEKKAVTATRSNFGDITVSEASALFGAMLAPTMLSTQMNLSFGGSVDPVAAMAMRNAVFAQGLALGHSQRTSCEFKIKLIIATMSKTWFLLLQFYSISAMLIFR